MKMSTDTFPSAQNLFSSLIPVMFSLECCFQKAVRQYSITEELSCGLQQNVVLEVVMPCFVAWEQSCVLIPFAGECGDSGSKTKHSVVSITH